MQLQRITVSVTQIVGHYILRRSKFKVWNQCSDLLIRFYLCLLKGLSTWRALSYLKARFHCDSLAPHRSTFLSGSYTPHIRQKIASAKRECDIFWDFYACITSKNRIFISCAPLLFSLSYLYLGHKTKKDIL